MMMWVHGNMGFCLHKHSQSYISTMIYLTLSYTQTSVGTGRSPDEGNNYVVRLCAKAVSSDAEGKSYLPPQFRTFKYGHS